MTEARPRRRLSARTMRIAAVVLLVASVWVLAWATGLLDAIDVPTLRDYVASWGAWGIIGFVVLACLANLVHVPGMVPVLAAILAFGDVQGAFIGWLGATTASMTTFAVMRTIGGRGTTEVSNPLLARMLTGLERHPIWTIAALRALFQNSPILNTVLALSPVGPVGYLVGSAIGMVPPVVVAALFAGWLLG